MKREKLSDINYWIPIVTKNRDFLIGYIEGMNHVLAKCGISNIRVNLNLDSSRFGIQDTEETPSNTKLKNNQDGNLEPSYFEIHCSCGNYYKFDTPSVIPSDSVKCGLCKKILILYTGIEDWDSDFYKQ